MNQYSELRKYKRGANFSYNQYNQHRKWRYSSLVGGDGIAKGKLGEYKKSLTFLEANFPQGQLGSRKVCHTVVDCRKLNILSQHPIWFHFWTNSTCTKNGDTWFNVPLLSVSRLHKEVSQCSKSLVGCLQTVGETEQSWRYKDDPRTEIEHRRIRSLGWERDREKIFDCNIPPFSRKLQYKKNREKSCNLGAFDLMWWKRLICGIALHFWSQPRTGTRKIWTPHLIMHALWIVHPRPAEQRSFNYTPPISWEM